MAGGDYIGINVRRGLRRARSSVKEKRLASDSCTAIPEGAMEQFYSMAEDRRQPVRGRLFSAAMAATLDESGLRARSGTSTNRNGRREADARTLA
jgi:hypothetical protein